MTSRVTTYGHALRFGVEIDVSGAPDAAVELALCAERLGHDTVMVTGPVSDDGVDAWSVATWATARTEHVQVAARLSPDQRPASIVGRSTSSLQLLSGGRASLVLTAADDPTAMAALEEVAATVGTLPGAALDRAVPIWVHGTGRSLAVAAGRLADGWVTDADVSRIAALNAVLDRAAADAGRDPREVRRAVTVPPALASDVDALTALVIEHGVSILLLQVEAGAGEGAGEVLLKEFSEIVAPAVRQRVEAVLPPGALSGRPPRRAAVRAQRHPGIGYDDLPDDLAKRAVEPGDAAYGKVRSTYMRGGSPGLVLRPGSVSEVQSALAVARAHTHLPLGIRSGGHGMSGRSTNHGGLVIDVGALDEITVLDEASRLVRIGPGARWRDVATVLQPHGWALSSGDYGGVGVGGLATAGGIGFLNRKHGLTIDHLRAVEVVLADGTHVRTSDDEHPELFWAVRGAGANFGIATAFEFVVDEVNDVGWAQLAFHVADPAAYLVAFGEVMARTPRDTTPFLILGQGMAQMMAMVDSDDPDTIISQLQPFAEIAPLVQQNVVIAPTRR